MVDCCTYLRGYLLKSGVDKIEDDSEFCEKEYELTREFFIKNKGFSRDDEREFYRRGFDNDTLECWKENYLED